MCHTQGLVAQTVDRDAYDAARHVALESLACGHVSCRGAAEAHRAAQTLCRAHGDVGAPLRGGCHDGQREDVGGGGNQRSGLVGLGSEGGVVAHGAVGGGELHDGAELLAREFVFVVVVDDELYAEGLAACEQHVQRLRKYLLVDEQLAAPLLDGLA